MNEKIFNSFMIMLISKNYHLWIKKLQKLIEQHRIWEYVDLNESKSKFIIENYFDISNYLISMKSDISKRRKLTSKKWVRMTRNFTELTNNQKSNLQQRQSIWSMREKLIKRVERDIQTIHLAVKTSARQYIFFNEMRSSIKQI
jgi:beta-lactamase class D